MIKQLYRIRLGIILILSLLAVNTYSNDNLSEKAFISVITCSEGEELYSAFGHSAIRICDSENKIDYVFNYGTFDFNTPNFYLKFANGKLNYMLSYGYFKNFLPEYFRRNRSVNEQLLNLNQSEKQKIFNALVENYKPENRFYKYDFFYDNCATRIYKIITENIDGEIVIKSDTTGNLSFRNYLHHYLINSPWTETSLNLLLGMPADKIATHEQSTFLPDFLMNLLDKVEIKNGENTKKLVKSNKVLLDRDISQLSNKVFFTPILTGWIILIVITILSFLYRKKNNTLLNYVDRILFIVSGFVGILLLYLWLITDHQVTQNNLNILWTFPSLLVLGFGNFKSKVLQYIMVINFVLLCIFILGWGFISQTFPNITLPISIMIAIRIFFILKRKGFLTLNYLRN